jgi:hypothetical protein
MSGAVAVMGSKKVRLGLVVGYMIWKEFCIHRDAVITVQSGDKNQRLHVSRRGVLGVWRLSVMRCVVRGFKRLDRNLGTWALSRGNEFRLPRL